MDGAEHLGLQTDNYPISWSLWPEEKAACSPCKTLRGSELTCPKSQSLQVTRLEFEYRQQHPKSMSSAGPVSTVVHQAQHVGISGEVSEGCPCCRLYKWILKK